MSGGATSGFSPDFWRAWKSVQSNPVSSGLGSGSSTSISAGLGTGLSNGAGDGTGSGNNGIFEDFSQYGPWLQGFGSILSGFAGYKNYQLGKDQLAFSKDAFNFNKDMQIATALAQAQGRLSEMQAYGTRQDLSYLQNLINTLQSYGQNTAVPNTLEGVQGYGAPVAGAESGAQQPQQQNAQTLLNQPSALSWNNSPLSDVSTPRDTAIRPDDLRFARR